MMGNRIALTRPHLLVSQLLPLVALCLARLSLPSRIGAPLPLRSSLFEQAVFKRIQGLPCGKACHT